MKKVEIKPGCIACGTCQAICPAVFTVTDRSRVNPDAPVGEYWKKIGEAARACPVGVIKCTDSESEK
jgi:ferredoxin